MARKVATVLKQKEEAAPAAPVVNFAITGKAISNRDVFQYDMRNPLYTHVVYLILLDVSDRRSIELHVRYRVWADGKTELLSTQPLSEDKHMNLSVNQWRMFREFATPQIMAEVQAKFELDAPDIIANVRRDWIDLVEKSIPERRERVAKEKATLDREIEVLQRLLSGDFSGVPKDA